MVSVQAVAWLGWWAVLVDMLACARIVRFLTHDHFPPIENLRRRLDARHPGPWGLLWTCHWCMSFWVALAVIGGHIGFSALWGVDGACIWLALMAVWAVAYGAAFLEDVAIRARATDDEGEP